MYNKRKKKLNTVNSYVNYFNLQQISFLFSFPPLNFIFDLQVSLNPSPHPQVGIYNTNWHEIGSDDSWFLINSASFSDKFAFESCKKMKRKFYLSSPNNFIRRSTSALLSCSSGYVTVGFSETSPLFERTFPTFMINEHHILKQVGMFWLSTWAFV